jgi:DNA-binding response OmpR family regulator
MLAAQPFGVVLLDLIMPELDGYQVLEQMKGDSRLRDIPVIVISALDDMESILRCIEMGATDYLPKPFDVGLLRARLNASLANKRLRDIELEYLEQVNHVINAAAAVEAGTFESDSLNPVAGREDALGQLARVFQKMAREVHAREQSLRKQVQELRVEIDEAKKAREVAEITETDYFRDLVAKAQRLRQANAGRAELGEE